MADQEHAGVDYFDVTGYETVTQRQLAWVGWTLTLLVYVVVLNLWAEYVESVRIDSFTVSILASIVLLALLVAITRLQHRVASRWSGGNRAPVAIASFLILFASKFVILIVIGLVFEESVDLGGFLPTMVLTLLLMASQRGAVTIWGRLGDTEAAPREDIVKD